MPIHRLAERRVRREVIDPAQTPAEVWALVLSLTENPNGYTEAAILQNVRDYARIATTEGA